MRRSLLDGAALAVSALLLAGYSQGGWAWLLGPFALVPWLLVLDRQGSVRGSLLAAWLMSVAFVLCVFHWFGAAFGDYVGIGAGWGLFSLLLLAPLLQPQLIIFALVRYWAGGRYGAVMAALAGAAAWVGCEWLWPKLLGDTLGHGLQPAAVLRQAADLAGAAGLTLWLLLVNEAMAVALARLRRSARTALRALAVAAVLLAVLSAYGAWRLDVLRSHQAEPAASLRLGLIQANITGLEAMRERIGSYDTIRHVLDTHVAMSEFAVREQGAEALLWSETIYPTTFGTPKSEDGAALDREILEFASGLGVPLVFGTYDRDAIGEYNSAAFVDPERGLLGHYRKSHPFPLTEWVPAWLDGPGLRRLLPWSGSWLPGDGPRVFPLRLSDGREANVLPLICLDDVRPQLALDGAGLGAEAIIGLSNDSWFTGHPAGARLHLAVASFRSIETRLPQLRVTTNGLSALVDESGEIVAQTGMGQQAVLVGEIPLRAPAPTLMKRWGDWIGAAGLVFLLGLALLPWLGRGRDGARVNEPGDAAWPMRLCCLAPRWRLLSALLRGCAAMGLGWLAWRMATRDGWQVTSLVQVQLFLASVLAPLLAAWALRRAFLAQARVEGGRLIVEQPSLRIEFPLASVRSLSAWRVPLPGPGVQLRLASGRAWGEGWQVDDPLGLNAALRRAGSAVDWADPVSERVAGHASARAAARHAWLDHAALKFGVFPLLMALPAFRLHQHIAFGGSFGEWLTYGAGAWLSGLLIWWVSWSLGLMLFAVALRVAVESVMAWVPVSESGFHFSLRRALERLARGLFYVGVPAWMAWRLLAL